MKEAYESVTELVEDVKKEMCDSFCRWPFECDDEETLYERCEECPLSRL